MAAVQQRSPTEPPGASPGKKKFIESMEDEVRRCAEHLANRQSRRSFRSLNRKAVTNGYSSATSSFYEGGVSEVRARNDGGVSKRSTLPVSFTMPEPEDRTVLSPRIIPPGGGRSPVKTPTHIFKFNGVADEEQQEEGSSRGNSAPPEMYPFFNTGSGTCSHENSVTPLQSPIGRTPIGAVTSRSQKSSQSKDNSPPPIPPKPSRNRSLCTPPTTPNRSQIPHKVEVSPFRRSSLGCSLDPFPVTVLAAATSGTKESNMEFPSANIDLKKFHEVIKAKAELNEATLKPAPPILQSKAIISSTSSTPPITTTSQNYAPHSTAIGTKDHTREQDIVPINTDSSPRRSWEPSIDTSFNKSIISGNEEQNSKVTTSDLTSNNLSNSDSGNCVSLSETSNSELSLSGGQSAHHETSNDVSNRYRIKKAVVEKVRTPEVTDKCEIGVEDVEKKVEQLLEELSENGDLFNVQPEALQAIPKSKISDKKSSDLEEMFTSSLQNIQTELVPVRSGEIEEPEVKSISQLRGVAGRHKKTSPPTGRSKRWSPDSLTKTGSYIYKLSSEKLKLEGVSESVVSSVKELEIQLKEKDEDIARLQQELKEKDERTQKLLRETKKVEREKWELLKRARDSAERSLHLRTQLDTNEVALRGISGELNRTRDELVSVKSANTSLRALLCELRASHPTADIGVQVDSVNGTLRRNPSFELAFRQGLSQETETVHETNPGNRMSTSSLGLNWSERSDHASIDTSSLHDGSATLSITSQPLGSQPLGSRESRRSKKRGMFRNKMIRSSGRKGSKSSIGSMEGLDASQTSLQGVGTNQSTQKEQWRLLEEAKELAFCKWDLKVVVAWMEAAIGMGQYSKAVSEKSLTGKDLLSLSQSDMEKKLGISNALHRRKLSLALNEQKDPENCQYRHAGMISHSWVAFEWAHDCGLAHLTEILTSNLVDGRVLNSLNKDDLKRYLKISKKVDQLSFLSGVELLRMHEFNREAIELHRRNSNNPLYWTNRDVSDWLRDINLQDYANNVIGGGVHGALLFLERGRFNSDHLAGIIQIPQSKGQLRRHLAGKMASLFSEDVSGSIDCIPSSGGKLSYSPLNLSPNHSGSQSPGSHPRSHSPMKQQSSLSGQASPPANCLHPNRRNSLSRNQVSAVNSPIHSLAPSPPALQRTGSTPSSLRVSPSSPQHPSFQRNQLESADKARMSLRESALRSTREEATAPPRPRTATPTVLSSTTV